jgi:hypothetical protein
MSRKDALLGMPHGTANNRLRKLLIFDLAGRCNLLTCYRCQKPIEDESHLSIEHKDAWQQAADPLAAFMSLDNVAFSHLSCNMAARDFQLNHFHKNKTACLRGHEFTPENTRVDKRGKRSCRACYRIYEGRRS